MKPLTFLFLLAFCLCPFTKAFAQGGFDKGKFQWGAHVSPLSMLSNRPRLDVGLLLRNEKMAYLLNVGYKVGNYSSPYATNSASSSRTLFSSEVVSFVGIQPEIRWILNTAERDRSDLGIGLILNRSTARSFFLYAEFRDNQQVATDDYVIARHKAGLVISYGKFVHLADWGYVQFYTGLGASFQRFQTENESPLFPWLDDTGNVADRFEGSNCCNLISRRTRLNPEIQLGFRFGLWVKR